MYGGTTTAAATGGLAFGAGAQAQANNAIALGNNSIASGSQSFAIMGGEASGFYSFATDFGIASGDSSATFGGTASGVGSFSFRGTAIGNDSMGMFGGTTTSAGVYGFAFGNGAQAQANHAIALGENSIASGSQSFAIAGSQASGIYSFATNAGIAAGDFSTTFGGVSSGNSAFSIFGTANGSVSVAMSGGTTTAAANSGFAFGSNSQAQAAHGIAMGNNAVASGQNAIALGNNSTASGEFAFANASGVASGLLSFATNGGNASGNNAVAFGGSSSGNNSFNVYGISAGGNSSVAMMNGSTTPNAYRSFAFGLDTQVQAPYGFAFGDRLTSYSFAEIVFGFDEIPYIPVSITGSAGSDRLFVVANGGAAIGIPNDNNAFTILKDGKTGIMRIPVTNILEVEGNASKSAAGDWLANSDARLKKNIKTFTETEALDKLLKLRGVTYEWNDDKTGSKRPEGIQYGFVAQEIEKVFPENVQEDNLGYLQTAYGTYDALYVQSIKKLNNKIEQLESTNKALQKQIDEIQLMLIKLLNKNETLENFLVIKSE